MPWGTPVASARAAMKTALVKAGVSVASIDSDEVSELIQRTRRIATRLGKPGGTSSQAAVLPELLLPVGSYLTAHATTWREWSDDQWKSNGWIDNNGGVEKQPEAEPEQRTRDSDLSRFQS